MGYADIAYTYDEEGEDACIKEDSRDKAIRADVRGNVREAACFRVTRRCLLC
jgi:hypothetical protein